MSTHVASLVGVMTGIWLWKAMERMRRFSASVASLSSSFIPSRSSATPSSLISPSASLNLATTSGNRSLSEMAYASIILERSFLGNWSPFAFMKWMRNFRISRNSCAFRRRRESI